MNKTWIIIKREYLTRVKAKTFIIMTLLMPLFAGLLVVVPTYLATRETTDTKTVAVSDYSLLIKDKLKSNNVVEFKYITPEEESKVRKAINDDMYLSLIHI